MSECLAKESLPLSSSLDLQYDRQDIKDGSSLLTGPTLDMDCPVLGLRQLSLGIRFQWENKSCLQVVDCTSWVLASMQEPDEVQRDPEWVHDTPNKFLAAPLHFPYLGSFLWK